eukprot:TRINITY_DN1013_c0_g1_i9.p1 TRINITY_DN1013_c0_g1~~TRINITY_DN1013_c0_g1_i9.p1  ORF type:complete len:105 (-),score=20.46 TRINITY_DN1013_c0_g1_i9:37-351(-)
MKTWQTLKKEQKTKNGIQYIIIKMQLKKASVIMKLMEYRQFTLQIKKEWQFIMVIQCPLMLKNLLINSQSCLLYTSDAADEEDSVDLGGRRIIKKKKKKAERII